jgi:dynein heavy chain
LKIYENEEEKIPKNIDEIIANIVIFGCVWSIGAILEEQVRMKFHGYMLDLIAGEDIPEKYSLDLRYPFSAMPLPIKLLECNTIYDICFDSKKLTWISWMMTVPPFKLPIGGKYSELIIPTIDSVRN